MAEQTNPRTFRACPMTTATAATAAAATARPEVPAGAAAILCRANIPARPFIVVARGEIVEFSSTFMDDSAMDLLQYVPGNFARSLWETSHNRGLSDKQLAWAHKLAMDYLERAIVPADDANKPDLSGLFAAFQAAKDKGAKRLTLRFEGVNVKPSRDLESLWVTSQSETEDGDYGPRPKYLGKITRSGIDSRLSDTVRQTLLAAANDPLSAAIRYGKVSGECSCCGRELTDPRSIERGIGPICATKFGW